MNMGNRGVKHLIREYWQPRKAGNLAGAQNHVKVLLLDFVPHVCWQPPLDICECHELRRHHLHTRKRDTGVLQRDLNVVSARFSAAQCTYLGSTVSLRFSQTISIQDAS